MSDIKKFLDYEGVKHLWSKINMQDYPNNETLMAVINAIDETKADKTDIVQSDWNQNDNTAPDYVKNRPFYEDVQEGVLCDVCSEASSVAEGWFTDEGITCTSLQVGLFMYVDAEINIGDTICMI